jgi:CRISPR-associated endonuclease/helicase Cas3
MTRDTLRAAFCQMFGVQAVYDFQVEVAHRLLIERKSVILQAPTGSGKTWTALFPFLHAWQTGLPFPRKCLYAVPLRVLTEQFQQTAQETVAPWPAATKPAIQVQTGEHQGDPTFESDLIFTTIDQVISSALSVPYSLSGRIANINAGAVFSSFLVCDELHLFPIDTKTAQGALATLIELLREFRGVFPFLLMTATLSDAMLRVLERELDAARIVVSKKELPKIASQQKTRRYHAAPLPLSAQAVIAKHQTRSIVICNQVERAITLFEALCQEVDRLAKMRTGEDIAGENGKWGATRVLLLHSRFIKEHRAEKETTIRRQFKKPPTSQAGGGQEEATARTNERCESMVIVATQTIEVGLDITSENIHSELAPASAIIQRAGRCARYQGEEGDVWIYPLAEEESCQPYASALCQATWEAFSDEQYEGQALTFDQEQQIVTQVHTPTDARLFEKLLAESYGRWQAMTAAMFLGDRKGRAQLIRKVDSRTILVHPDPSLIRDPYGWHGFSLYHGTLRGWVHELREQKRLRGWMIRFPVEVEPDQAQRDGDARGDRTIKDIRRAIEYRWESVLHEGMIDSSPIFVVHPRLVSYDPDKGFRLRPGRQPVNIAQLSQEPAVITRRGFETRYALEDYTEHIRNMLSVYHNRSTLATQIAFAAQRLAASPNFDLAADQLERAVLLAIALHDVGKLQVEWQAWSHAYQEAIAESQPERRMIVHTHFTPGTNPLHKQAEEALRSLKRPPHAAEGAWASWPILLQALNADEWLSQAIFTAITRHHSSFARTIEAYTLHQECQETIGDALALIGLPRQLATYAAMQHPPFPQDGALHGKLIASGDTQQWLVYALIVRTLRLCDGRSLEYPPLGGD